MVQSEVKRNPKLAEGIVNIGDFYDLLNESDYTCYLAWIKETLEEYKGYSKQDDIPLINLLQICDGVLAYEDRDTFNSFSLFVVKNIKRVQQEEKK